MPNSVCNATFSHTKQFGAKFCIVHIVAEMIKINDSLAHKKLESATKSVSLKTAT